MTAFASGCDLRRSVNANATTNTLLSVSSKSLVKLFIQLHKKKTKLWYLKTLNPIIVII